MSDSQSGRHLGRGGELGIRLYAPLANLGGFPVPRALSIHCQVERVLQLFDAVDGASATPSPALELSAGMAEAARFPSRLPPSVKVSSAFSPDAALSQNP
jgi:hypothetical protein